MHVQNRTFPSAAPLASLLHQPFSVQREEFSHQSLLMLLRLCTPGITCVNTTCSKRDSPATAKMVRQLTDEAQNAHSSPNATMGLLTDHARTQSNRIKVMATTCTRRTLLLTGLTHLQKHSLPS